MPNESENDLLEKDIEHIDERDLDTIQLPDLSRKIQSVKEPQTP